MPYTEEDYLRDKALVESYYKQADQQYSKDRALVQKHQQSIPVPGDREAFAYGEQPLEPTAKSRTLEGLETAGELTGIPGGVRLAQHAMGQPVERYEQFEQSRSAATPPWKDPKLMDALGVGLIGGGLGAAKAVGALGRGALGLALGAGGGGLAQAALGPEARQAATQVDDPFLKALLEGGPAIAGSILGAPLAGAAGAVGRTGVQTASGVRSGLPVAEAFQRAVPSREALLASISPGLTGSVQRGRAAGEFMDLDVAAQVGSLEREGVPVSPAQAQAMQFQARGQRPASTELQQFEQRSAAKPAARAFQAQQGAGSEALARRRLSELGIGVPSSAAEGGSAIKAQFEKRLEGVGKALESSESALISHRFMNRPDNAYRKAFSDAFAELRSDQRLFGKGKMDSVASKATQKLLNRLESEASKVRNGAGAIRALHRMVNELDEAFAAGGGLDSATQGKLYGLMREKVVSAMARNKSLKDMATAWDRSMSDYANVVFENQGKYAQGLTKLKPNAEGDALAGSEQVAKSLLDPYTANKVALSVRSGVLDGRQVEQAVLAQLRETSMLEGQFRPEVFAKKWNGLSEDVKSLLNPKARAEMDSLAKRFSMLGEGPTTSVMEKGWGAGSLARAAGGSIPVQSVAAVQEAVRGIKPGYYGAMRGLYMPPQTPGKLMTGSADISMGSGQAFSGISAQEQRVEEARRRAQNYMKKNRIPVTGR